MFTHFLKFMSKNPQHDRVKTRGRGSRAVYTMCKKTSDLVENGFPNSDYLERDKIRKIKREVEEEEDLLEGGAIRREVSCGKLLRKSTQALSRVCSVKRQQSSKPL